MIWYVTGGERSGKSAYAQKLALDQSSSPVYIATSRIWDEDFRKRVKKHTSDRDERWTTIEEEKYLGKIDLKNKVAVIDCVTLWLTNFYTDTHYDIQQSLKLAKEEFDILIRQEATLIIISNELGMGVHAETEVGRKFVELQGWMNQYIAAKADKAVFMVSGIPVTIK
ncbi:MAG TPA: bifunctional adenosylcobinamide kinase/adenosylcobinamide-phosphate guanylyltransferase [Bacteroidia bacterium]|jgi:adenosylcobinamide kinase/adenosylcobinamide-phosphate guanylyltransferase|nr:bifunctional adenosylcobinamide kinase/adenosylcobinamide-phosphate guanylyltransferase [Bacteroidia bacterium]